MALSLLQGTETSGLASALAGASRSRRRRVMKTATELGTVPVSSSRSPIMDSSPEGRAAAVAAAAAFSGLAHPLLSSPHAAAILRASAAAATQTAALMGLQSLGIPSPSGGGVPVHLHATLASSPALFQHGSLFNWSKLSTQPADPAGPVRRQRKAVTKRSKNKTPAASEPEIPHIDSIEAPLSPPTSGSSPSTSGDNPNTKTIISSGGSSASEPGKDAISGRDKVFECRVCNRCFGYKHVLQNHERTHTGEKPFACPECNKRFTRDHHLKTHMRLHTGEKPYHCTHCDRQFVQVANLRRHLRVHTGERPYACELCTSRFSDSNQLKAHMLIHKGEKPFSCSRCAGRFRRRHHLMHHKCPEHRASSADIDMDVQADDGDVEDEDDVVSLVCSPSKKRDRKARETRRVVRVSSPEAAGNPCLLQPEQTEPEDLSMSSMLNNNNNIVHVSRQLRRLSSFSSSDEEPHEATSLLQHRHAKFRPRHLAAPPAAMS